MSNPENINLLDLVPSLDRHLRTYRGVEDTDSTLAGYLADAVEALAYYWGRTYAVTVSPPKTYIVMPFIAPRDRRPIILMASIIYKLGNINLAGFSDGDFSYNPFPRGKDTSSLSLDVNALKELLPHVRLASPSTLPLRGFNNIYNRESYDWIRVFSLFI